DRSNARHYSESAKHIEDFIRRSATNLKPIYLNKNPRLYTIRDTFLKNLKPAVYDNLTLIWDIARRWPQNNEIYPLNDVTMTHLIQALKSEEIISAKNAPKGTQLKLLLTLKGNQKVIFKPKWYDRNVIIDGPVYSGKDRFNSEIFAFYLGSLLNRRWTPVTVGRKLNMKEIYHKAERTLKKTMTVAYYENQHGNDCFFFLVEHYPS
ncbi:Glycosaminoglycan xylosylkinase like, partial [Pseudolycoriella hygida]